MRFTKQAQLRKHYYNNTKKTETKFLWWPLTTQDKETRWFETVTIEYYVDWELDLFCEKHYYWKPFRFIDK